MANPRTLNHSFSGGEISPEMYGRIDDGKYQSGAALVRNLIATPQGPVENRPGTLFVRGTRNNAKARLIPFVFSDDQAMVIEVGAGYFRFHAQGGTLEYPDSAPAWIPPSGAISISYSTPTIVSWQGHGLTTGNPIVFYLYGGATLDSLPTGLQVGHTYTVDVIDADHFHLIDNGAFVGLTTIAETGSHVAGGGETQVSVFSIPSAVQTQTSEAIGGLASTVVPGGIATLNVTLSGNALISNSSHSSTVRYQYNSGAGWVDFVSRTDIHTTDWQTPVSLQISVANLANLQLRIIASVTPDIFAQTSVAATMTAWSVDIPVSAITPYAGVRAYYDYKPGDVVSYSAAIYTALAEGGGMVVPGTDATVWMLLPSNGVYEVENPYLEEDLFAIHYAQSQDVLTLVHPKYPPAELSRLGAYSWKYAPIEFGQLLPAPTGVSVVASPGYVAQILSVTLANPADIRTVASHTLALGDGIYISNLKAMINGSQVDLSGFYLVNDVPKASDGSLIPDRLTVMDYNGNLLNSGGWSQVYVDGATIQYGSKIFDITNYYVVTALTADGINQSPVSQEVQVLDNLNVSGSYNTISWNAVPKAGRYWIYKKKNGLFGYIGETTETSFRDNNIAPDFSITPPLYDPLWSVPGDYPGAVGYYDQRRCFGGSLNKPQDVGMSRTGTESDFSYSLPVRDTDRIYFRVASLQANAIRHIIPLTQLLLLTSSTEFRVSPLNSDAITPTDISAKAQSYVGASNVTPNIINNSLVYCANRGGHVREMGYNWQANGFITGDLSLRAIHLFDNLKIQDQTYQKAPHPIVWFVSSNGKLLGLTYIPEQQIGAWHQHNTDGVFESVCAIPEGNEDAVYAIVKRTIMTTAGGTDEGGGTGGEGGTPTRRTLFTTNFPDGVLATEFEADGSHDWYADCVKASNGGIGAANNSLSTMAARCKTLLPADCWAEIGYCGDDGTYTSDQNIAILLRQTDTNCYWINLQTYSGKTHLAIGAYSGLTPAEQDSESSHLMVPGDIARAEIHGNVITLYINDTLVATYTDAANTFNGSYAGWMFDGQSDGEAPIGVINHFACGDWTTSGGGGGTEPEPVEVRYIEKFASRVIDEADPATWHFVDCGANYSHDTPVTEITGLDWLEGKQVSILADGAVHQQQTVTNGTITLQHAARNIHIGLPYEWDLETLPLTLQVDGFGQGRTKNINKVWVRVTKSSGIWAGPELDKLTEYKQRTTEPYGQPPRLQDRECEIVLSNDWQESGQVFIHGESPLPATVTAITMQTAIGG